MFGAVWAQAETRKVLGALGARVLDETVGVPRAHERLADAVDDDLQEELRVVLEALAEAVREREAATAAVAA
jgi:chromate reductase